ncbi:NAD(P)-dependent oxidoreductase [Marinomonas pontica]|uniref:NAD-dependent epimerase/dehydratase family protein n=1 Tax=Marinomonas pontica TaxID=264739 RepID=UPI002243FCC9|nr:NAD(P)-dependent oxidoreductase [Marinomonas pontica]MCW8354482.1 NAD(P)-dependent oxidoreductase [Marinomonas pontica]
MMNKIAAFINEDLTRIHSSVASQLSESYGQCFFITGGAGFLGTWLCEWLMYLNRTENAGIKVYVLDREKNRIQERFENELQRGEMVLLNYDVRSLTEIPREVNYIIHAAATPDTSFHASCPIDTMSSVAEGTASMLRAASRLNNLKAILNVSSSAIYANSDMTTLTEDSTSLPFSHSLAAVYPESKRYAEKLCQAARNELRLPIVSIRPFTFCGPYQNLSSPWILNTFINDALNKRPIRIYGDGQTTRGVMYGADFSVWVLVILLHGKSGNVYNVGSDNPVMAYELANYVAKNFSFTPSIMLNTSLAKINDRTYLLPDTYQVKKDLNLTTFTDLELSISRTVTWFTQIYK